MGHPITRKLAHGLLNCSISLIRAQRIGDLFSAHIGARANDFAYNLSFTPDSFNAAPNETFDPEYMNALYQLGYDLATKGHPWKKRPPGVEAQ